jgi:predicted transcriptional regulator
MACVNPDGTMSPIAASLLKVLATAPLTPEEIAALMNQPLFKVRSSLREIVQAGLLVQEGDNYIITAMGKEHLASIQEKE